MQCRAVVGLDWGLKPEKVLWLYRSIVLPKITYAAVVWWKVTEGETLKKTLEHVQGVALRGAFGVRKSTPIAAIGLLIDQVSLDLAIVREAARAAYRLTCCGQWLSRGMGHTVV